MNRQQLISQIREKKSFLCIGLDSDIKKIPKHLLEYDDPIYEFNTDDLVATKGDTEVARDAMELINVVPNPYYGYSEYESNQLDNRIKITNLPQTATISVFTVNGTLVRKLKKDDTMTSIVWDLKNNFVIPIASGLYIIHVATEIDGEKREKVIKWFGTLRPIDLDTF